MCRKQVIKLQEKNAAPALVAIAQHRLQNAQNQSFAGTISSTF